MSAIVIILSGLSALTPAILILAAVDDRNNAINRSANYNEEI
jgi:hypothetical protein